MGEKTKCPRGNNGLGTSVNQILAALYRKDKISWQKKKGKT
jgi:hypothetical protein